MLYSCSLVLLLQTETTFFPLFHISAGTVCKCTVYLQMQVPASREDGTQWPYFKKGTCPKSGTAGGTWFLVKQLALLPHTKKVLGSVPWRAPVLCQSLPVLSVSARAFSGCSGLTLGLYVVLLGALRVCNLTDKGLFFCFKKYLKG